MLARSARRLAATATLTTALGALGGISVVAPAQAAPGTALLAGALKTYIVQLDDTVTSQLPLARQLVAPFSGEVRASYTTVLNGFSATLPAAAAPLLRAVPGVKSVREDVTVTAAVEQSGATWGLDRVDQRSLPLNGKFNYPSQAGLGTHVYVIDTGINPNHSEFTGRVGEGRNFVAGGFLGLGGVTPSAWTDCNGHGTHVASTAAGTTYGIAKKATVHAVRVLNCQGSGSGTAILAGMDWVAQNHGPNAVANMSIGTASSSPDINTAAANLVAAGVAVAVAGGNDNRDACTSSPAAAASVLTVGATRITDARASFSNIGTCLDLFAPGEAIMAANYSSNTGATQLSGTSMASPHVAGVLALVRSVSPGLSAAAAQDVVTAGATNGAVTNAGAGSPNKLLYSGVAVGNGNTDTPPTAAFASNCNALACSFDASASSDDNGIASYAWNFGNGASGSGRLASSTYASAGTYPVTPTVTDTAGQTATSTGSVTVSSSTAPCTGCTQYDGTLAAGATAYPGGNFVASGTIRGWLRGPSGANFDLTLQKQSCFILFCSWSNVASGATSGSSEDVTYTGTNGTYRWAVQAVSGSGAYSFWR